MKWLYIVVTMHRIPIIEGNVTCWLVRPDRIDHTIWKKLTECFVNSATVVAPTLPMSFTVLALEPSKRGVHSAVQHTMYVVTYVWRRMLGDPVAKEADAEINLSCVRYLTVVTEFPLNSVICWDAREDDVQLSEISSLLEDRRY